jgi:hypothetical protein
MLLSPYTIPALIALVAKLILLFFALRPARLHGALAKLFAVEVLLSIGLSATEVGVLQARALDVDPDSAFRYFGYTYFIICVPLLAVLAHLATLISLDNPTPRQKLAIYVTVYGFAALVEVLLVFTPWVISGFERLGTYSYTRVAGPLYWLFEWFVATNVLATVLLPIYGLRSGRAELARSRCKLWIATTTPIAILVLGVVALLHFRVLVINVTVTLPILLTLHLAFVGYAIHNRRIIDLDFYRPGSRVRREKMRFYQRLLGFLREPNPPDTKVHIAERLATLLDCKVVLFDQDNCYTSPTKGNLLSQFPKSELEKIREPAIAGEIENLHPQLIQRMREHGVAAIFPLFAHSRSGAHWLVVDEGFSRRIHTPMDFQIVGRLLKHAAGWCLDNTLRGMALQSGDNTDTGKDWQQYDRTTVPQPAETRSPLSLDEQIAELECQIIREALVRCKGSQAEAARQLGIKPNTLYYRIRRCGLEIRKPRHLLD